MRDLEQNTSTNGEEQMGALIGTLKRVEAPNDFDFRVRARIAKGKPSVSLSWFPATVRVAVPLGLFLSVGGYFAFNAVNAPQENGARTFVESVRVNTSPAPVPVTQQTADQLTARVEPKPIDISNTIVVKDSFPKAVQPKTYSDRSGGGSYDEAARERRPILPRGFNPGSNIPAKDVLNMLGMTSTFDGTGWKVTSVGANNTAEHSGIKTGDVIEAIDGQTLVEKTSFPNRFNGKSLRVRRDGKSIQIDLKP